MANYSKGAKYERELFELLKLRGYAVVRVAGSGRARAEQPDLLASNGRNLFAIECKYSSSNYKTIVMDEVNKLVLFCKRFGASPLLAFRFANSEWKFVPIDSTVDANVSVKKTDKLKRMDDIFL